MLFGVMTLTITIGCFLARIVYVWVSFYPGWFMSVDHSKQYVGESNDRINTDMSETSLDCYDLIPIEKES